MVMHHAARMRHILLPHLSLHCALTSMCYYASTPNHFRVHIAPSGFLERWHFHNNYNVKTSDCCLIIIFVRETLALTYNASLRSVTTASHLRRQKKKKLMKSKDDDVMMFGGERRKDCFFPMWA